MEYLWRSLQSGLVVARINPRWLKPVLFEDPDYLLTTGSNSG
jgi:hypothetical protein